MKQHIIKSIMTFLLGILLIIGCDSNNGTGSETPESATISGTITFTGDWPLSDYIYVSLNSTWPPQGAPAASMQILASDVTNNTYSYTFDNVTFDTYGSITTSWLDVTNQVHATNQSTLGAYGGSAVAGFMDATSVTCSTTEYSLTGLNFTADLSLAVSQ